MWEWERFSFFLLFLPRFGARSYGEGNCTENPLGVYIDTRFSSWGMKKKKRLKTPLASPAKREIKIERKTLDPGAKRYHVEGYLEKGIGLNIW